MKKMLLFIFILCGPKILFAQWTLYFNTHYGAGAFASNVTGNHNAAFGPFALGLNTTGHYNTAVGSSALYKSNATNNVGVGRMAAYNTTTGSANTAIGANAMQSNTTGFANVAVGYEALKHNVGGYWNTAVGQSAGPAFGNGNLYNATAIGYYAINTGNAQVRIGNEFVTDIGGQVSWSTLSDGRYKRDVREDIAGLDFINKLRPVSYMVDEAALAKAHNIPDSVTMQLRAGRKVLTRQTGFVAQEVEATIKKGNYRFNGVNAPQNESGQYSIRYAEFVVPLVKAVQELTARLETQESELQTLKKQLETLTGNGDSVLDQRQQAAALHQNNPNPFSVATEIRVSLPENIGDANLVFYSLEGKQLKVLPLISRGDFSVQIKSSEFTNGLYIYALIADGKMIDTKRLMITGKTR